MPHGTNPVTTKNVLKNPSNQGDHSQRELRQSHGKRRANQEGREGGNHTRPSDK